jgi:type I restriction enzyme S subunit
LVNGDHKRQWISNYSNKQIPIPCPENPKKSIEIQRKIVRILDKFTELTAALTTELTARKKQYKYYHEELLNFTDTEVHYLPMGDPSIGEFQRGKRFVKDDMISEGVPCIHYGEMYTYYGTWANESKSFLSKDLVKDKKSKSC